MEAKEPASRRGASLSVRARTTIAAAVVVAGALAASAVGLVVGLKASLVHHVDDLAEVRAADIAAGLRDGPMPATISTVGDEGTAAQIVDGSRRVIAASRSLSSSKPVASFRPPGSEPQSATVPHFGWGEGPEVRLTALNASSPAGPVTIYIASSLDPAYDAIDALRRGLALAGPLLLILMAVTTWIITGRALRPVDEIITRVGEISHSSLERRVPVPASRDEIGRLAETMNEMLGRLQEAAARQKQFVADAAHELQTPLTAARADLEVALAHPVKADWPRTAGALLKNNRRMESLTSDLLFLARSEHPETPPPSELIDLDQIVLVEARHLRSDTGIDVRTDSVSPASVRGGRADLVRVVRNLLENAARYASSGIEVGLASRADQVVLTVDDDGPGIPAGDRERIFLRFTRLDEARTRPKGGSGLGLAIVKEVVERHGGSVAVEDSSAGARFVVRFPAGDNPAGSAEPPQGVAATEG